MPHPDSYDSEVAHPLVAELLRAQISRRPIVVYGIGNGRSVPPILRAGLSVHAVEEDGERRRAAATRFAGEIGLGRLRLAPALESLAGTEPYAAALATSALLHGTPHAIAARLAALAGRLGPGAGLFATFGSRADPRFGTGTRIDAATFAPDSGREAGVPHAYFSREELTLLLDSDFTIDDLTEGSARESAGRWAHDADEAGRIVHWFLRARRRGASAQ